MEAQAEGDSLVDIWNDRIWTKQNRNFTYIYIYIYTVVWKEKQRGDQTICRLHKSLGALRFEPCVGSPSVWDLIAGGISLVSLFWWQRAGLSKDASNAFQLMFEIFPLSPEECTKKITLSVNFEVCHDNCGFCHSKICVTRQFLSCKGSFYDS